MAEYTVCKVPPMKQTIDLTSRINSQKLNKELNDKIMSLKNEINEKLLDKHQEEIGEFFEWKEDEGDNRLSQGISCLVVGQEYLKQQRVEMQQEIKHPYQMIKPKAVVIKN